MLYILIIELLIIYLIIYKYGIISPVSLGVIVFFIYGQSFYIDYLLFDQTELLGVHVLSDEYFYITLLYLTFIVSYSLYPIIMSKNSKSDHYVVMKINNSIFIGVVVFFSILLIGYFIFSTLGYSRYDKIAWYQSHKLVTFTLNIVGYIWIIVFLKKELIKNNFLYLLFTLMFIVFAFYEGGRELLVYIIITLLFLRFKHTNSLSLIALGIGGVFVLTIWKDVYSFIIMNGGGIAAFLDWIDTTYKFSLSRTEPAASIFLLSSYFQPEHKIFFDRFNLTYVENVVGQILRTFRLIEYPSIGEQAAEYFKGITEKGKGLAFSGILESILNFGYFGPAILGFTLGYITKKIEDLYVFDEYIYKVLSVFCFILIMKIARTELAVVLKIYLLPMILSYFIMLRYSYKK